MLHILTLFLLPFFLSSAEASGVFMYLCFGEGCSEWDSALTWLSILSWLVIFVSAVARCCKEEEKEEQELQTVTVDSSNQGKP